MFPLEILYKIAEQDQHAYQALLAIPEFARSKDVSIDFMVHFGHTVQIEDNTIAWFKSGKYHRINGPALQKWNLAGQLVYTEWIIENKMHRTDGPALQSWDDTGQLASAGWYKEGKLHRTDDPAYQEWNDAGQLTGETWYTMGKRHREGGPAV